MNVHARVDGARRCVWEGKTRAGRPIRVLYRAERGSIPSLVWCERQDHAGKWWATADTSAATAALTAIRELIETGVLPPGTEIDSV